MACNFPWVLVWAAWAGLCLIHHHLSCHTSVRGPEIKNPDRGCPGVYGKNRGVVTPGRNNRNAARRYEPWHRTKPPRAISGRRGGMVKICEAAQRRGKAEWRRKDDKEEMEGAAAARDGARRGAEDDVAAHWPAAAAVRAPARRSRAAAFDRLRSPRWRSTCEGRARPRTALRPAARRPSSADASRCTARCSPSPRWRSTARPQS